MVKGDIALQGDGQQVALSFNGSRLGISQGLTHVALLIVHHSAHPGTCQAAHSGANGCSIKGALGITANGLAQDGAHGRAASRAINGTGLGFGLGAAAGQGKKAKT